MGAFFDAWVAAWFATWNENEKLLCNEYAQNKNIERIQELSLSLIDQENKIQKYIVTSCEKT